MSHNSEISKRRFVWISTDQSVSDGTPSVLAIVEVAFAAVVWWGIALGFQTFNHLWTSICIAPFLLLKSTDSIKRGVIWFSNYHAALKDDRVSLAQCSIGAILGAATSVFTLLFLVAYFPFRTDDWANFIKGAVFGYCAIQTSNISLNASITLLGGTPRGGYTVLAEIVAAVVTVVFGWVLFSSISGYALRGAIIAWSILFVVDACVSLLGAIAGFKRSGLLSVIFTKVQELKDQGRLEVGIAVNSLLPLIRSAIESDIKLHKKSSVQRLGLSVRNGLGLSVGVWLRTIGIRFAATALHLSDGFRQLPQNFFQTLFVIDLLHGVELVPGYAEARFTSEGLLARARKSPDLSEALFFYTNFLVFVVPGYLYRIGIKSTFWVFLPLVYVARQNNSLDNIESRKEWARRFLAVITLAGFTLTTLVLHPRKGSIDVLGTQIISPLEFLFLIDFNNIRPWHMLQVVSAVITIYLYFESDSVSRGDRQLARADTQRQAKQSWLLFLMKLRNLSAILLVSLLLTHGLLAFSPLKNYLPEQLLTVFRSIYGPYLSV
jgi:hypothetical protein